ncbi:hypothetical protein TWF225_008500 [Orbilia oligospora]|uniref:Uncharacterized protein n=1 Tax=Orbilia oligospora TaxID=2813651 RepID=A0A7C8PE46_ORBOL|nr:hypothetical protein TWF751_007668 [Orbilia oligospora]KAF3177103.1 hypothetical protein TWF225_008500 [Orbilia oligospora]KAF3245748.1 hypothetical protein TWF217_010371 [Orbilia oligospora]KAF3249235.1 hypothetical protein TWF128_007907 [Orbilia oligospora]KAF3288917.1 hypothetical protein TWF132_007791 [Orbilia oligospora]
MTTYQPPTPQLRKKILTTLFISLLLDLLSFTLILPLFPQLLAHYQALESTYTNPTLLRTTFAYLNSFKAAFSRPISSRFDVVLLGGAMGSLFSFLQAFSAPIIGSISDKSGRRTALLYSMMGNILSVLIWVFAVDFPTFVASRIVGGLSEGNVQLAIAIATDVSSEDNRGATLALVGVAFSIAFTLGPMMGAFLASKTLMLGNPFSTAAAFSLVLIVTETVYLYFKLPETKPPSTPSKKSNTTSEDSKKKDGPRSLTLLNLTHFLFLLVFSGMEFSLTFMTFELFSFSSADNGRLLGFVGLTASILQGSFTRRAPPHIVVKTGLLASAISFLLLARIQTKGMLYVAAFFLSVTSATVVTGLTALASFRVGEEDRGRRLGGFRGSGQIGRACGPVLFCSLYWWAGREVAYGVGAASMLAVMGIAWGGLDRGAQAVSRKKFHEEKKDL